MITNIIELMRALDYVRVNPFLTAEQKVTVAKELSSSMPPKALCNNAQRTFEIAEGLFADFRSTIESPQRPKEDPKTEQRVPARSEGPNAMPRAPQKAHGRHAKVA
jgi:hypothetical protein